MGNGQARERTLGYVNRIRVALGKKPLKRLPKGKRREPRFCPVAKALPVYAVYGDTMYFDDTALRERLMKAGFKHDRSLELVCPKYVDQFVTAFDKGLYPDLIAK